MSWMQLVTILKEDDQKTAWAQREAMHCPRDGELLEPDPKGKPHCRFDGWPDENQ